MMTVFSCGVYLQRRYVWVVRQLRRAMVHAGGSLNVVELARVNSWLVEARVLREGKGFTEAKARRVVRLLLNVSSMLERHVPALAELTRELKEAEQHNN